MYGSNERSDRSFTAVKNKISRCDVTMFPQVYEALNGQVLSENLKKVFHDHMEALRAEISRRFADIGDATKLSWVVDPFSATTDDVSYISSSAEEELIDVQMSTTARKYLQVNGYVKFWLSEGQKIAKQLSEVAVRDAILPFATTYLAENAFSAVVHIKSKARNRLNIHSDLYLALTTRTPNIKKLLHDLQAQDIH
jgi:hypothetical protein